MFHCPALLDCGRNSVFSARMSTQWFEIPLSISHTFVGSSTSFAPRNYAYPHFSVSKVGAMDSWGCLASR